MIFNERSGKDEYDIYHDQAENCETYSVKYVDDDRDYIDICHFAAYLKYSEANELAKHDLKESNEY